MESIPPKYVDQYVQEAGSAVHPLFTHLQKEQRVPKCSPRSGVFDSLKETCFTDTIPIGQGQISVPEKSAAFLPYVHEQIFNSYPLYYLPDKTPQARVAILYYLVAENGLYFFLSQEATDPLSSLKSESYSDVGGRVHLKENRPERFLEATLRLIEEKNLFQRDETDIKEKSQLYFWHSLNERQMLVILIPVPLKMLPSTPSFLSSEGKGYHWIKVESLVSSMPLTLSLQQIEEGISVGPLMTVEEKEVFLKIRPLIFTLLKDQEFVKLLRNLK